MLVGVDSVTVHAGIARITIGRGALATKSLRELDRRRGFADPFRSDEEIRLRDGIPIDRRLQSRNRRILTN